MVVDSAEELVKEFTSAPSDGDGATKASLQTEQET
jgi:hypothetical protein